MSIWARDNEQDCKDWLEELRTQKIRDFEALLKRAAGTRWKSTLEKLSDGLATELEEWYGSAPELESARSAKRFKKLKGFDLEREVPFSGVDLNYPERILPREHLLTSLIELLRRRHVLLYSPPATGKTALTQLLSAKLECVNVLRLSCASLYREECFQIFVNYGLDLKNCTTTIDTETLFILDDCHAWFGLEEFWNAILKRTDEWCPPHIKFIYVATQLSTKSNPSPLYFRSLPGLTRKDFLLSDEEATMLINNIGKNYGETFSHVLVEEAAGIPSLMFCRECFLQLCPFELMLLFKIT